MLVHLYNPGSKGTYPIRVKVADSQKNLNILDSRGETVSGDIICSNSKDTKDCELMFNIELKESAYTYVKICPVSSGGSVKFTTLENLGTKASQTF